MCRVVKLLQDVVVSAWTDNFNIIRSVDYGVVVVQFQFVRVDVLDNCAELLLRNVGGYFVVFVRLIVVRLDVDAGVVVADGDVGDVGVEG